MTSKSLFFKLMKENTKQRLWSVALISLCYFFYFPVRTALIISSYMEPSEWENAADQAKALNLALIQLGADFMQSCSITDVTLVCFMFLFSAVCGISGFAYLYSRKKTDFYHSLPVRREVLFLVNYVNGALYVAVPYLISMLIAAVMVFVKGAVGLSLAGMMKGWLMHMAFFLLLYSTVIVAVMMTGNLIVSGLGTLVFYAWAPGVLALAEGYYSTYYVTYCASDIFAVWAGRLSPAGWYITAVASDAPEGMALKGFFAAVILTAAALLLYRKRPSEAAGHAMAFRISQPVIKVLIVVPCALLGSLMFFSMLQKDNWSVFGLICGLLVSYCIIEIIYNFDFKRLFAHKRQLALCAVFSAAILVFFRFDLSGYDSYCPTEERLKTMGISCYSLDADMDEYHAQPKMVYNANGKARYVNWSWISGGEIAGRMQLNDMTPVHEIAEAAVENVKEQRKARFANRRWDPYESGDGYTRDVILCYQLNSGKKVLRKYTLDLTQVKDQLDAVYLQEGYKTAVYPVLTLLPEEVAGINYKEQSEYSHVKLADDVQKAQLLEVYQKELSELTAETRRNESPVAALQFKTLSMQKMIDEMRRDKGDYTQFNGYQYFPVYPSFTGTIAVLKECGTEVGSLLTEDTVEKIALEYMGSYPVSLKRQGKELTAGRPMNSKTKAADLLWSEEPRETPSLMIMDREQIREILESSISQELNCTNRLNESYNGIRIVAFVPYREDSEKEDSFWDSDAEKRLKEAELAIENPDLVEYADDGSQSGFRTYSLFFDYDKVPSFVKEEFGLTDELMRYDRDGL